MIKSLFEDALTSHSIVNINPVVDPSAIVTDPANQDYKPRSRQELKISLGTLIDDLSDENVSDIYDSLKNILTMKEDKKEREQMKKSNDKIEEAIRLAVRKILAESNLFNEFYAKDPTTGEMVWKGKGPAPTLSPNVNIQKLDPSASGRVVGPQTSDVKGLRATMKKMTSSDFDVVDPTAPAAGRTRRNKMEEGEKLKELAKEFGFKNPNGVLQFIKRVSEKFKSRSENYDEVNVAMLETMKDYIAELASGGDLSPADVQMLYDHPEHLTDLETFRIYADKKLKQRGL